MVTKEKPISFITPMVQAIIEDQKTKTRRVIKGMGNKMHYGRLLGDWGLSEPPELRNGVLYWKLQTDVDDNRVFEMKCPWKVGQILWVRETWTRLDCCCCEGDFNGICQSEADKNEGCYMYRATHCITGDARWKSSRYMPRIAARIFLKVKNIRIERLQDITEEDAMAEGVGFCCPGHRHAGWNDRWISGYCHDCACYNPITGMRPRCYFVTEDELPRFRYSSGCNSGFELRNDSIPELYRIKFSFVWDEINLMRGYSWNQNPWVWVVEFERVEV
jgi:hypothetical protein